MKQNLKAKEVWGEVSWKRVEDSGIEIRLEGDLTVRNVGDVWRRLEKELGGERARVVRVMGERLGKCDGAGIGLLLALPSFVGGEGCTLEVSGVSPRLMELIDLHQEGTKEEGVSARTTFRRVPFPEELGKWVFGFWGDFVKLVTFVGELALVVGWAMRHPMKVRWREVWVVAERVGVNALPIVSLICFLLGLIMAFQAAIPMRRFGAQVLVGDLVAISMIRELGPLMTAILLAGRSGSAFASEIGTMKVNEELNALTTMGMSPIRFLVVPRILAAVMMTPILTIYGNLMGLVGGGVVMVSLGFPLVTYFQAIQGIVDWVDFLGGLSKSFVFGILVAAIGCFRGLNTQTGASAVGDSTTKAVVSGLLLIVVADGVFAVIFYQLGL